MLSDAAYSVISAIENVNTNPTMIAKMEELHILVKREVTSSVCSLVDV